MAKEKSLDLAAVQTWLAAWKEKELYSDAAVRDLLRLIPDNDCMVVITCRVGCPPRSLVFRRLRRVVVFPPTATTQGGRVQPAILDPDQMAMFNDPTPPMAPITGQLWLQVDVTPRQRISAFAAQRIFRWEGTYWLLHGFLRDEPIISRQGKQECSFEEALANAHEIARRNRCQTIYRFDDSTWGNA